MAKGFAPGFRFWFLSLCILIGYGAIGYRLVDLHAIRGESLAQEVKDRRFRIITSSPRRGDVYDANMELLATSHSFVDIGFDPGVVEQEDVGKLPRLAKIIGIPLNDLHAAFGVENGRLTRDPALEKNRWRVLAKRVGEPLYDKIKELDMRSVYGNRVYSRVYPKKKMASHVVGYVRDNGEAATGVERAYDYYLAGQRGWKESELGTRGEMPQFRRRLVHAQNGMSVVLSIDSYVQFTVERVLDEIEEKLKPKSASIIVSNPKTGFVIAMANYPSFDPNKYKESEVSDQRNRSLTDPVEPGSTFKIVATSAALEEGLVNPWSEFDCSKSTLMMPSGYNAPLPKDSHDNGILTVEGIVTESSNRGAAQLGALLGEDGFYEYVKQFGFGEPSGFGFGGENEGILAPVDKWDRLTLTRMPMGHAIGATPMQIHNAMATIANGGVLMRPQVVKKIIESDGEKGIEFGPMPRRRVVSMKTARTVASMLEKTVSDGTAQSAVIDGFRIAGKTGTTKKLVNGRYSSKHHVGSFTGFLPADDPEVVITVVIDDANYYNEAGERRIAYGGKVAAPAFRDIASKLIPYYALSSERKGETFASFLELDTFSSGN